MKVLNDKIDKRIDLCQLYEKMDEKGREILIEIADRLFETQVSIGNDKSCQILFRQLE
jgi:hypothetical protein